MSRYPEADEAQHRHFNDSFYPSSGTPNPDEGYDDQSSPYDDRTPQPFAGSPLQDPLRPTHNLYTSPPPSTTYPPQPPATSTTAGYRSATPLPPPPASGLLDLNTQAGCAPSRVPRRYKSIKKMELFHGNFVLDNAVPERLLDMCANRTEREFTHMRYSAVTCDPNDFKDSGFTLRQMHFTPPRRTELLILITMYNEDEEFFCRTMHGVIKNIAHLCQRERSKTWGKDSWKRVVVCIVSDGRGTINSRTLSVLATMGCYQEGVAKTKISNKDVTAHLYEYTIQISITPSLKIEGPEKGTVPVQLIFCLKEKNRGKINSHRWFFNAFGATLQPNVCMLLDAGSVPGPTSIYYLWKAFDIDSSVGGACGEIVASKGKYGVNLINPLVAAQNFEYKMSNILNKSLESVFGYITVLPSAFSAYRYIALQNNVAGEGPLQRYFLGEAMHGAGADILAANTCLAEDRILCWEIVSKRGGSWTLHYVKSAYAVTDAPDRVPALIFQRLRWLNGSFLAAVYSTVHFHLIYRSSHTFLRKFWIHVEILYQLLTWIFSWFALANYYIAFFILSTSMEDPSFRLNGIKVANIVLNYFYLGLLAMSFILSLGTPQDSKWGFTAVIIGFGLITCYTTFAAFILAFKGIERFAATNGPLTLETIFTNAVFRNVAFPLLTTLGLYITASVISFEPWHMITSFIQYLLISPSYVNVLNVYAFTNVSWGMKGDSGNIRTVVMSGNQDNEVEAEMPTDEKDINALYDDAIHDLGTKPKAEAKVYEMTQTEGYYRKFRINVLLAWVLTNGLLAAAITATNPKASAESGGSVKAVNGYMAFLLFSVAGFACIQFAGSAMYIIVRLFAGE